MMLRKTFLENPRIGTGLLGTLELEKRFIRNSTLDTLLSLIEENVFSDAPGKVSLSNITEDKYFAIRDRARD